MHRTFPSHRRRGTGTCREADQQQESRHVTTPVELRAGIAVEPERSRLKRSRKGDRGWVNCNLSLLARLNESEPSREFRQGRESWVERTGWKILGYPKVVNRTLGIFVGIPGFSKSPDRSGRDQSMETGSTSIASSTPRGAGWRGGTVLTNTCSGRELGQRNWR